MYHAITSATAAKATKNTKNSTIKQIVAKETDLRLERLEHHAPEAIGVHTWKLSAHAQINGGRKTSPN